MKLELGRIKSTSLHEVQTPRDTSARVKVLRRGEYDVWARTGVPGKRRHLGSSKPVTLSMMESKSLMRGSFIGSEYIESSDIEGDSHQGPRRILSQELGGVITLAELLRHESEGTREDSLVAEAGCVSRQSYVDSDDDDEDSSDDEEYKHDGGRRSKPATASTPALRGKEDIPSYFPSLSSSHGRRESVCSPYKSCLTPQQHIYGMRKLMDSDFGAFSKESANSPMFLSPRLPARRLRGNSSWQHLNGKATGKVVSPRFQSGHGKFLYLKPNKAIAPARDSLRSSQGRGKENSGSQRNYLSKCSSFPILPDSNQPKKLKLSKELINSGKIPVLPTPSSAGVTSKFGYSKTSPWALL